MPISMAPFARRRRRSAGGGVSTRLLHTFTGADSAVTPGAADTGQTMSIVTASGGAAVWGRQTNRGYVATGGVDYTLLVATTGLTADGTLTAKLYALEAGCGLSFRVTDANNHCFLEATTSASPYGFKIWKRVAGVYTTLATVTGIVMASGDTLGVVLSGSSLTGTLNGSAIPGLSATDAFNASVASHGLIAFGSPATTRYDDLTFVG